MTAAALRAAFATVALGAHEDDDTPATLGDIVLAPHQREAVARCRVLLAHHHGAILADQVGLGKTFVALAVAQRAGGAVVVAPAALRGEWARAAAQAGVAPLPFTSLEALGRGQARVADAPLVIVDEAHHLRTAHTRRHAAVRARGVHTPLLLLTATPVHNRARDLAQLVRLFAGDRALTASDAALQALVVRRTDDVLDAPPARPRLVQGAPLALPPNEDVLAALLALPAPVPPRDGGASGALVTLALVRAWASSDAALRQALRRRLAMARALVDALAEGRHPSRADLAAWCLGDDAQQLALPLLVAPAVASEATTLRTAAEAHADAVRALLATLPIDPTPADQARAAHLLALRAQGHAPLLAFTHSADSARALWRLVAHAPGTALLTADGAEVAGGRLPRADALARFAPRAQGAAPPPARDTITLLIATDVLAEGLNLQDARAVVHLDAPWTAARLEQRVGRVARPGSSHAAVHLFAVAPPAGLVAVEGAQRVLRAKLRDAERVIGPQPLAHVAAWPAFTPDAGGAPVTSALDARERTRALLARWRASPVRPPRAAGHTAPTVLMRPTGDWVAVVRDAPAYGAATTRPQLVTGRGLARGERLGPDTPLAAPTDDPVAVVHALEAVAGCDDLAADDPVALAQLARWQAHRRAAHAAGVSHADARSRTQRHALARAQAAVAGAPSHRRALRAALAEQLRPWLTLPGTAQRDDLIQAWTARHPLDDEPWLEALARCAASEPPMP
jgi:superfamily II DNA or RNA helicase